MNLAEFVHILAELVCVYYNCLRRHKYADVYPPKNPLKCLIFFSIKSSSSVFL